MLTVNGSDITNAVTDVELTERVNSGAAVLKFSVLKSEALKLENGGRVVLSKDGTTAFVRKIFSRKINRDIAELSAFDSLAELKTVLPIKREAVKADRFIKEVFAAAAAYTKMGGVDSCDIELPPDQYKNVSLLNILYRVAGEAEAKGHRFVLRDEAGTVVFKNSDSLTVNTVLNGGNVIDFDYEHSVLDSCNYVKLISNNHEIACTETAIAKNESAIASLGTRGIVKEVYEKNPEQLTVMARELLEQQGKEKEQLSVTAVGDISVRAGCSIRCDIDGVGRFWARVKASSHSFSGKSHIMRLELERCDG